MRRRRARRVDAAPSDAGDPTRLTRESTAAALSDPVHVRVIELYKSYGDLQVLKGVTFDAYRAYTNMILGVSGSGKTVLLRQLLRLERPDSGRIEVDGEDIVPLDEIELARVRRKFSVVFQESALFDSLSVYENVELPLHEHEPGLARAERRARVEARLDALGVLDAAGKLPGELSGGMKKRVAVARALVTDPQILVYDEPTRGLDPVLARTVDDLIESTRQRFHVTSIVISHDMRSVIGIGHYVNILHEGRIAWSSNLDDFLRTDNPQARAFLSTSGVKLAAGRARANDTSQVRARAVPPQ